MKILQTITCLFGWTMFIVSIVLLAYRFFRWLYVEIKTVKETSEIVVGKVVDSYSLTGQVGDYIVWVEWNGLKQSFSDKEMYLKYKAGDKIKLILIKKFDKNNILLDQTLEWRA